MTSPSRLLAVLFVAAAVALAFLAQPAAAGDPLPSTPVLPDLVLAGTDGTEHALRAEAAKSKLLVLTFFSSECPCQRAHDPRLRDLFAEWHPRGVGFLAVDSNAGATLEHDQEQAKARGYPYPILIDPGAKLADALGALFATHTMVVDPKGRLRYRGGIDASTTHLRPDGPFYLRDALTDLVAGRAPRNDGSKAMGCSIQR